MVGQVTRRASIGVPLSGPSPARPEWTTRATGAPSVCLDGVKDRSFDIIVRSNVCAHSVSRRRAADLIFSKYTVCN